MRAKQNYRKCIDCGKRFVALTAQSYQTVRCPECAAKARLATAKQAKTCVRCGREFIGSPGSLYCDACAWEEEQERKRKYRTEGFKRHRGDIDKCERCGKDYVVKSGLQKYCPDCQRQASLEKQRERKRRPEEAAKRRDHTKQIRKKRIKVCVYCEQEYQSTSSSNCCSDECRKRHKHLQHTRYMYSKGKASRELWEKQEKERLDYVQANKAKSLSI